MTKNAEKVGGVQQKPKRRPYLLKKKALSTGFFESGSKREEAKGETETVLYTILVLDRFDIACACVSLLLSPVLKHKRNAHSTRKWLSSCVSSANH